MPIEIDAHSQLDFVFDWPELVPSGETDPILSAVWSQVGGAGEWVQPYASEILNDGTETQVWVSFPGTNIGDRFTLNCVVSTALRTKDNNFEFVIVENSSVAPQAVPRPAPLPAATGTDFYKQRIEAVQRLIVAYETVLDGLAANPVLSYTLDTGQSRQVVTRVDVVRLTRELDSLYNRYATLHARVYGSSGGASHIARPAW